MWKKLTGKKQINLEDFMQKKHMEAFELVSKAEGLSA